jgi:hypothetical protein
MGLAVRAVPAGPPPDSVARMRAVVIALAVLLTVPAAASAQIGLPIPQDVSLTGSVVASHGPTEKTVRFTLRNNGPGPVAAHWSITVQPRVPMTIVAAPGCTVRTVSGFTIDARCELGTNLAQGATRSADVRVRFTGIQYGYDQVIGSAQASDTIGGLPRGDANGANDQVTLDMGIAPPPPSFRLELLVPGIVTHGEQIRRFYLIRNTGGSALTDVRVIDDHCAPQRVLSGGPALPIAVGAMTMECLSTAPPHRRDERPLVTTVTVTARAGVQLLTRTERRITYLQEPDRSCGRIAVRRRGKRTRWKTSSTVPDLSCKRVKLRLRACLTRGKAPSHFRCLRYPSLARVVKPGQPTSIAMTAKRV